MKKITIKDMIKEWLIQHSYSGLVFPDMPCGCGFDSFMPCDNPDLNECVPGYEKIATKEDVDNWEGEGELREGDKFYILKKPKNGGWNKLKKFIKRERDTNCDEDGVMEQREFLASYDTAERILDYMKKLEKEKE